MASRSQRVARLMLLDDLQKLVDKMEVDGRRSMNTLPSGVDAVRCFRLLQSIGVENLDVEEGVGLDRKSKRV